MSTFLAEPRFAYLVHLTAWAVPVLLLQLVGLAFLYRGVLRQLARAVVPPVLVVTGWLVLADHLAIGAGIWHFGEGKTLGVRIGAVPLEEVLFFLLTNSLVGCGLALFAHRWVRPKVGAPGSSAVWGGWRMRWRPGRPSDT